MYITIRSWMKNFFHDYVAFCQSVFTTKQKYISILNRAVKSVAMGLRWPWRVYRTRSRTHLHSGPGAAADEFIQLTLSAAESSFSRTSSASGKYFLLFASTDFFLSFFQTRRTHKNSLMLFHLAKLIFVILDIYSQRCIEKLSFSSPTIVHYSTSM